LQLPAGGARRRFLFHSGRNAMRANDAICGFVLILFAATMIALTVHFPDFPGQKYGPALFPRVLSTGIIICAALLIWKHYRTVQPGERWVVFAPWTREPWRLGAFFLMLALLFAYIFVSETIGFIPMALVFLLALFLWLGVRPITAVIVAIVATITIHEFFSTMLRVPLPRGWLDSIL
jgi:putative tricarboxylic transport membrane protein